MHSFHSLNYLLRTYYVPGIASGDTNSKKQQQQNIILAIKELIVQWKMK